MREQDDSSLISASTTQGTDRIRAAGVSLLLAGGLSLCSFPTWVMTSTLPSFPLLSILILFSPIFICIGTLAIAVVFLRSHTAKPWAIGFGSALIGAGNSLIALNFALSIGKEALRKRWDVGISLWYGIAWLAWLLPAVGWLMSAVRIFQLGRNEVLKNVSVRWLVFPISVAACGALIEIIHPISLWMAPLVVPISIAKTMAFAYAAWRLHKSV